MAITANIISEFNDRGVKAAEGAFGKFSKNVVAAGAVMATALAAVTKGLYEAAQAAAEDQKSFTQLAQAMKNVTGASDALIASTDKHIGKMSMQLGIADDKLRPAFANLLRATGNLSLSQTGLGASADLATAKQIDMESASNAVAKALAGNTTALVKMLPGLRGVIDNGSTAEEVLAALNGQVGGSAEANTRTFAGALERLKVIFGEMVETVGSWLLPALTRLADLLNNSLGQAFTFLSETVGPKVEEAFAGIGRVLHEQIIPFVRDFIIPLAKAWADIYYNQVLPAILSVYEVLAEKLGKALTMIREKVEANRDTFDRLGNAFRDIVTFITRYVIPAYGTYLGKALDGVILLVGRTIDIFAALERAAFPVAKAIASAFVIAAKAILGTINSMIDGINLLIKGINAIPGVGNIPLIPRISLPSFDIGGGTSSGGLGIWGENRGDMPTGPGLGGIMPSIGAAATGGTSGGRTQGTAPSTSGGSGPSFSSLGLALDLSNWQPPEGFLAGFDPMAGMNFTVNVEGGLATSPEIGRAVVDAIKQYTNVSGPAAIAVA
jgi:hypothetical protein